LLLQRAGAGEDVALPAGVLVTFLLRMAALRFDLRLQRPS
jgi:hypothetical protein